MILNLPFFLLEVLIMIQYLNFIGDIVPSYCQIIVFFLFLISLFKDVKTLRKGFEISVVSIIIFIVVLIRCIMADKIDISYYSPMQAAIARYQFMVFPFIYCYILKLDKNKKKILFNLSITCILITVFISFYYMLLVDPQAVRNTQGVSYFGVGDFQLMYAIAVFMGPLLIFIINSPKKKFYIFNFICYSACLLLCNLVTTWVIAAVSISLSMFIMCKSKKKYTIAISLLLLLLATKNLVVKFCIDIANSGIFYWSTSNKIMAIANVLSGNFTNIDTLSRRSMLINQSLTSFKENPLFGLDFREHVAGNVGCHSQWADDLARYGIIGNFFIFLNYFYVVYYTLINSKHKFVKDALKVAWITSLVLGFLNPCLSGTILMIIFVVIPSSAYIGKEEINENISD